MQIVDNQLAIELEVWRKCLFEMQISISPAIVKLSHDCNTFLKNRTVAFVTTNFLLCWLVLIEATLISPSDEKLCNLTKDPVDSVKYSKQRSVFTLIKRVFFFAHMKKLV